MQRLRPPDDITPTEFFTRWVPAAVAADEARRTRLVDTVAAIEFTVHAGLRGPAGGTSTTGTSGAGVELGVVLDPHDDVGGTFTIHIAAGVVRGEACAAEQADLRVRVDLATWRALNRGEMAAPEAVLRRRLTMEGDFLLGLKLHLILS